MTSLRVVRAGPRSTVQDAGRHRLAHLGVPVAGAADAAAMRLANAVVANPAAAAGLESTLGGDEFEVDGDAVVAVAGAPVDVAVDAVKVDREAPIALRAGQRLRIGRATTGVYVYLAVAGGFVPEAVLGSRSCDTLSGIGPAPLRAGDVLPVGAVEVTYADPAPTAAPPDPHELIRIYPGPHLDLMPAGTFDALLAGAWSVTPMADRVAVRLAGNALDPGVAGIASEGLVPGAVQLPPDGQPVVFLANHPVTGGYPVIAVVASGCLGAVAQTRPGQRINFAKV